MDWINNLLGVEEDIFGIKNYKTPHVGVTVRWEGDNPEEGIEFADHVFRNGTNWILPRKNVEAWMFENLSINRYYDGEWDSNGLIKKLSFDGYEVEFEGIDVSEWFSIKQMNDTLSSNT